MMPVQALSSGRECLAAISHPPGNGKFHAGRPKPVCCPMGFHQIMIACILQNLVAGIPECPGASQDLDTWQASAPALSFFQSSPGHSTVPPQACCHLTLKGGMQYCRSDTFESRLPGCDNVAVEGILGCMHALPGPACDQLSTGWSSGPINETDWPMVPMTCRLAVWMYLSS